MGVCHAHSNATIMTEISKKGTFHFPLDLMPASGVGTGQSVQMS